jgi:hypothetical protein
VSGAPTKLGVIVPGGWTLELLPRQPDHALLRAPSGHMVTIDFCKRGIRMGYSTSGRFLGEGWNTHRKKYVGRGWRQELVNDAVALLQEWAPGEEMA